MNKVCIMVHEIEFAETREILKNADVIMLHDTMTKNETIVYGCDVIKAVADGKLMDRVILMVMVELDQDTGELEYLLAAIQVLLGKHEYPNCEE